MRTLHESMYLRMKRVCVIVSFSFPSRSLMSLPTLIVRSCVFSHQFLHHPDFQRPQRPCQGVAETAQAHTLAGVECLTERLTQLETQVMSPSSLEFLQLHGHIAHAEAILREPPRFPVPGRRYRDLHIDPERLPLF